MSAAHDPPPPRRPGADPPPVTVVCFQCGAVEGRLDPPGWILAIPSRGPEGIYLSGACPACLSGEYTGEDACDSD